MALWQFTNLNKYGNPRSRVMHRPDGEAFGFNPSGFGPYINVRRYKYEYKHEVMPPAILEINGKTYLIAQDLKQLTKYWIVLLSNL